MFGDRAPPEPAGAGEWEAYITSSKLLQGPRRDREGQEAMKGGRRLRRDNPLPEILGSATARCI